MPRLSLLLAFALLLTGCRQSAQNGNNSQISIQMEVSTQAVGVTELTITLTDAAGLPVTAQKVEIRGDMTHAGMAPVLAESDEALDGVYRVPFEWTMSGDWLVTVSATLADGTTAEQRFDLSIRN